MASKTGVSHLPSKGITLTSLKVLQELLMKTVSMGLNIDRCEGYEIVAGGMFCDIPTQHNNTLTEHKVVREGGWYG